MSETLQPSAGNEENSYDAKAAILKFRLSRLILAMKENWAVIKMRSDIHKDSPLLPALSHKELTFESLHVISNYAPNTIRANYVFTDKFLRTLKDVKSPDEFLQQLGKSDRRTKDAILSEDSYDVFLKLINGKFEEESLFTFNPKTYNYHLKPEKSSLPRRLTSIIKSALPPGFDDTFWKAFRLSKEGMEQFVIHFDTDEQSGQPTVEIFEGDTEQPSFRGYAFIDARPRDSNRVIGLLRSETGDAKYAHLILFNQGARGDNDTIFFAHLSYFIEALSDANAKGEQPGYHTKNIVIEKCQQQDAKTRTFDSINECEENERIYFQLLRDHGAGIIAPVTEKIHEDAMLKTYLARRNNELGSYISKYRYSTTEKTESRLELTLCYVKKTTDRATGNDSYDYFANRLVIETDRHSVENYVRYFHMSSRFLYEKPERLLPYQTFEGRAYVKQGFIYCLMEHKNQHPIFLTLGAFDTEPTGHGQKKQNLTKKYFAGSITGMGDDDTVAVTCACILVPDKLLYGPDMKKYKDLVYKYLISEAKKGWGVVNPSNKRVWGFELEELEVKEDNPSPDE